MIRVKGRSKRAGQIKRTVGRVDGEPRVVVVAVDGGRGLPPQQMEDISDDEPAINELSVDEEEITNENNFQ